jgi:hypothetical protein
MKLHKLIDLKLLCNFPIINIRRKRDLGHGKYNNSYSAKLLGSKIQELIPKGGSSLNSNKYQDQRPSKPSQSEDPKGKKLLTLVIPKLGQLETNGEKSIYTMLQP